LFGGKVLAELSQQPAVWLTGGAYRRDDQQYGIRTTSLGQRFLYPFSWHGWIFIASHIGEDNFRAKPRVFEHVRRNAVGHRHHIGGRTQLTEKRVG
jgi:hypothetical protein